MSKSLNYQIMLNLVNGQGGQLALSYMTNSGEFCLAQMSLSPK